MAASLRCIVTLSALAFVSVPALAASGSWEIPLTGAAEAPTPGDPAASGTAKVSVDDETLYLCYQLATSGLGKATAAHVHKAAKGAAGPPVVTLDTPLGGASKACAKVDPALAKAIIAKPSDYYVNVHSEKFPAGAIRGQLAN
ncbi:MAG TPA: CHRD domain-containing protein [Sphingobium sp.]